MVAVPGSSSYYKGSIVAYSEEAKINLLNVSAEIIKEHSIVSKQVALAMAKGVKNKLKTDYAIAVTGNAGPTQDKTDKSVGVVFIAFVSDNEKFVREFDFGQPREKVINRTVSKALEILQKEIL